jgi:hypothetical protein
MIIAWGNVRRVGDDGRATTLRGTSMSAAIEVGGTYSTSSGVRLRGTPT